MKRGVTILNHDTGFRTVWEELTKGHGRDACEQIRENAGQILEELCGRYAHLPKAVKAHTEGNMFRNAAVYLAVRKEYPEEAMELLEYAVEKEGRRIARLLGTLLRFPGMKGLLMALMPKILDNVFGEAAGFAYTKHQCGRDEVRFDIHKCPYCEILTEIGCPELIHISCDVDQWIYGSLPGIEFRRSGTLGTGASCCDFCLIRRERLRYKKTLFGKWVRR